MKTQKDTNKIDIEVFINADLFLYIFFKFNSDCRLIKELFKISIFPHSLRCSIKYQYLSSLFLTHLNTQKKTKKRVVSLKEFRD